MKQFLLILIVISFSVLSSCERRYPVRNSLNQEIDEHIDQTIKDAIDQKIGKLLEDEPVYWRYRKPMPLVDQTVLSKELLTATYWVFDPDKNPYLIFLFYNDNTMLGGTRQSGIGLKGTYTIEEDGVNISTTYASEYFDKLFASNNINRLVFDKNYEGLFYKQRLHSLEADFDLYPEGLYSTINNSYNYKNIDVKKTEYYVVTTDNLKLRKGPGIEYESVNAIYADYNIQGAEGISFLIPGHPLKVIAESQKEYSIGGFTGKWLLVKYPVYEAYANYWVFGSYTKKIDDKEFVELQLDLIQKLKIILDVKEEM